MSDLEVLEEVKKSNLRGRGGAGFPAGRKWEGSRNAPEPIKYLIVNADEGDPGAFMDRAIHEGDPHAVLEGMIIGGYAMEPTKATFMYATSIPWPLNINMAIEQAKKYGLLGDNILGSV